MVCPTNPLLLPSISPCLPTLVRSLPTLCHLSLTLIVAAAVDYRHSLFRSLFADSVFLRHCLTGVLFGAPLLLRLLFSHRPLKKPSVRIRRHFLSACLPSPITTSVSEVKRSNIRLTNGIASHPLSMTMRGRVPNLEAPPPNSVHTPIRPGILLLWRLIVLVKTCLPCQPYNITSSIRPPLMQIGFVIECTWVGIYPTCAMVFMFNSTALTVGWNAGFIGEVVV